MIQITPAIAIHEDEIKFDFIRASGPGGQNVNKVASAVQLRFNVKGSPCIHEDIKRRLISLAGRRVTRHGILIIDARRFRTQEKNRKDAIDRLTEMITSAAEPPKHRVKTRPTISGVERRLESKHRETRKKRSRQFVRSHEE
jgi:ribosome-associated protein